MLRPARLGLLALLRGLRFVGNTLKHFVLRCLLFWPHVLRSLRHIWPLCPRTSPGDIPKNKDLGGQARPSFPGASGCEGYSIIYASRDPNRSSEPHLPLGSGSTEVWPLGPIVGQSQSTPHSSLSSIASSLSSTHLSDGYYHGGSPSPIGNPDDINVDIPWPHIIPRLDAPLTLTHSRITSTQFAGAPRRSRPQSRPPSPLPYSPSPPPQPVPSPQSSVPDSPSSFQMPMPDVESTHDPSEGSYRISVHPPSRSQTTEAESQITESESQSINFPQSPLSIQISGAEYWTQGPSDTGSLDSGRVNARPSNESLRLNSPTLFPNRARSDLLPFFRSQVTLQDIPFVAASMNWSDGKKRSIGLMHSEQVSRYVNKGDV